MELLDIYNNIKNPIDDPNIINRLINIYGDDSTLASNLYDKIIDQNRSGKVIGKVYPELQRKFELGIFNKWKHEVISMTDEELQDLINNGVYPESFRKLKDYLKSMPEVKTLDELNNYKYGHDVPTDIKDLFENYSWDSTKSEQGWKYVSSRNIYAGKRESIKPEHELYLNVDSTAIHRIAMEFISKCEEMNIPYSFKYNEIANRDDVIVIYSDTKHLALYIDVLEKIKEENPDLNESFHQPPILSGKVTEWMGYGTTPREENTSFNLKRANAIESGINKTTKEWVKDHIIKMINFRGSFVHFFEYITVAMVETKIEELKSSYRYYDDCSKADKKGYDPDYALSQLGLKMIDLEAIVFKDTLYKELITNMEDRIITFCENPDFKFKIELPTRNENKISFNQYDMDNAIRKISPKIGDNDPDYQNNVRDNIIDESKKVGIDKNKYCFEVDMIFELINESKNVVKKQVPTKSKQTQDITKIIKARAIDPIRSRDRRSMMVHTSYVPSKYLTKDLQELLDRNRELVIPYLYKHMSSMRILLPYLIKEDSDLADQFIDEAIDRYPELQEIYNSGNVRTLY